MSTSESESEIYNSDGDQIIQQDDFSLEDFEVQKSKMKNPNFDLIEKQQGGYQKVSRKQLEQQDSESDLDFADMDNLPDSEAEDFEEDFDSDEDEEIEEQEEDYDDEVENGQHESLEDHLKSLQENSEFLIRQKKEQTELEKQKAKKVEEELKAFDALFSMRIQFQQVLDFMNEHQPELNQLEQLRKEMEVDFEMEGFDIMLGQLESDFIDLGLEQDSKKRKVSEIRVDEKSVLNDVYRKSILQQHNNTSLQLKSILNQDFTEQLDQILEKEKEKFYKKSVPTPGWFQDDAFYQQLLKDFIHEKSEVENNLQWSQKMAILKNKEKESRLKNNQVDRRASKGRKIRYDPMPKLENFFTACPMPSSLHWDEEKSDSFFKTLKQVYAK